MRREGRRFTTPERRAILAPRMLAAVAGIALTAADGTRIEACIDAATLDRWIALARGATTAADRFR